MNITVAQYPNGSNFVPYTPKDFAERVDTDFRWRSQNGVMHRPKNMATRHLFHTLRMIWNHTVPDEMQVHPLTGTKIHFYTFSSYYTPSYMRAAVLALGVELSKRDDITPIQWLELEQMFNHLRKNPKLLEMK